MPVVMNHDEDYSRQLDSIESIQDFCRDWRDKWRGLAVTAQQIVGVFSKDAAKVIGILITIADQMCKQPQA